jgi:hypothetical protein
VWVKIFLFHRRLLEEAAVQRCQYFCNLWLQLAGRMILRLFRILAQGLRPWRPVQISGAVPLDWLAALGNPAG